MKLLDIESLAKGTPRQREAYDTLKNLKLFEQLREESPVLAGTIPLDLDVEGSDLDIICSAENLEAFGEKLKQSFAQEAGFSLEFKLIRNRPTVLARFRAGNFPVEIFAQDASVFTQPAVLHMLIEARLLTFAPKEAKEKIRELKRGGMKTEPAFAACFEIEGNPYDELLKISRLPDHEILMITHRFRFSLP
jgi:hypothetical protein